MGLTLSLRVEGNGVDGRRRVAGGIVVGEVLGSEPGESCLGSVSEDLSLGEGDVGAVELDLGVEGADADDGGNVHGVDREVLDRARVVVGVEGGEHDFSGPAVGDGHLVPRESTSLVGAEEGESSESLSMYSSVP